MRRRGLLVVGLVLAIAAGAFALTRDGDPAPTGEGGSSFGAGPERERRPSGLLDALAPLLAAGRQAQPAAQRAPSRRSRLPLPAPRAAARLILVGFAGRNPTVPFFERLRTRGWGGVVLERGNYAGAGVLPALAAQVTAVAKQAGHGAPLVAAAQPGGPGTAFPDLPPRDPALTPGPAAAGAQARRAGRRLRRAGIALNLAPVAHVGHAGGPWEGRAYGDDPAAVGRAVTAAVGGYRAGGVAAVVGRFPGEGGATQDPALGTASVGLNLDELRAGDLTPFRAAVAARAPAIQMSPALYAAWDGVTPATLLRAAVQELRDELRFHGVVISADLAVTTLATGGGVGQAAVQALRAGCDLVWVPGDTAAQEEAYRAVLQAIRSGELSAARVARALRRVVALKRAYRIS